MKRNHTNHRVQKSGQSPYARYAKAPYRYSDELRAWERSMGARAARDKAAHDQRRHERQARFRTTQPHHSAA